MIARERNDAVSKLNLEMKNLEKLERERRDMMMKIEDLSQEQQSRKSSMDMSKNVGDLNMKLKMEIGALKGENEGLNKKNDEIRREISALESQIQVNLIQDFSRDMSIFYELKITLNFFEFFQSRKTTVIFNLFKLCIPFFEAYK